MVIRPSRHKPQVGDLFVLNLLGRRWIVGRVVRTDAKGFGLMTDDLLLYFYAALITDPWSIRTPLSPDLLIAPVMTNTLAWRRGYYAHIRNEPLLEGELLTRHVFENDIVPIGDPLRFRDEYRTPVAPPSPGPPNDYTQPQAWSKPWVMAAAPGHLCGWSGLWSYIAIDSWLSWALGIPDKAGDVRSR